MDSLFADCFAVPIGVLFSPSPRIVAHFPLDAKRLGIEAIGAKRQIIGFDIGGQDGIEVFTKLAAKLLIIPAGDKAVAGQGKAFPLCFSGNLIVHLEFRGDRLLRIKGIVKVGLGSVVRYGDLLAKGGPCPP